MNEQGEAALEAENQILATPFECMDGIGLQLLCDFEEVVRSREPRVEDLDSRKCVALDTRG